MAESMSVEKNKFLPLHDSTTSFRPGWRGREGEMRQEGVSVNVSQMKYEFSVTDHLLPLTQVVMM